MTTTTKATIYVSASVCSANKFEGNAKFGFNVTINPDMTLTPEAKAEAIKIFTRMLESAGEEYAEKNS